MRPIFPLLLLTLIFTACGAPTPAPNAEPTTQTLPASTTPTPPEPSPMIDSKDDQLTTIRADYQRIEAALVAGNLRKDSVSYRCEDAMTDGNIYLYSDDSGVVLATHGFGSGDHGGAFEKYYFRAGELFFHFHEAGHWEFGGAMKINPDGTETPGTIDYITEERRYYSNGKIMKALTKSYRLENGEDLVLMANAAAIEPLDVTGPPPGKALLEAAIAARSVDCRLVDAFVRL